MIDPTQLRDRAYDLLGRACGGVNLCEQPNLRIYDAGLVDSLTTMSLIIWIENELGISISPFDLDTTSWATPELFIADLERRARVTA